MCGVARKLDLRSPVGPRDTDLAYHENLRWLRVAADAGGSTELSPAASDGGERELLVGEVT